MSVEKTKRDYAALLAKRANANTRRLYKLPLCLDPTLYAERDAAREALREAEKEDAAQRARGTSPRAKMSDVNPLAAAKTRLEAAEDAIRDASIVLVVEGRTSDETVRVIKSQPVEELPDDASTEAKARAEADNTFRLNRALFLDAYQWAEDLDGERLADIGRDQIEALLPTLTSGEMDTLVMARNIASSAPDFPTSRRS